MAVKCAVKYCNEFAGPGSDLPFHRSPRLDELRKKWCLALEISFDSYKVKSKNYYVCSKHFKQSDYGVNSLKNNCVPSQKLAPYSL